MQVYAIMLGDKKSPLRHAIDEFFPDNYQIEENVFLVRARDATAKDISRQIGLTEADERDLEEVEPRWGVVLRLSPYYFGFWYGDLWEWLSDSFEENK